MTAEGMFNELGYELENTDLCLIAKRKHKDYDYMVVFAEDGIYFRLDDKTISFGIDCVIDMEMLKAINKMCEELGWIEPTIKINKIEHYKWEE